VDLIAEDNAVPVIPTATVAAYRGKTIDLRVIGRDHNVHFALTGNARRQDGRLIVTATLYEADDVQTVWSRRFDVPDRANGWKSIIQGIYDNFQRTTVDVEAARAMREHPDSLDKRDLLLAAGAKSLSPLTRENNLARIALIERALAIDPNDVRALRADAQDYAGLVADGFSAGREADLATAMKLIDRALLLAPNDVLSEAVKASVLRAQGNLEAAAVLFRKVIELLPVQGRRYREFGSLLMVQGHFKEALENYVTANCVSRKRARYGSGRRILEVTRLKELPLRRQGSMISTARAS
jgi:tetratricopeptide (TPR) repeat protein